MPQLGHATYLFSKPRTIEEFIAVYTEGTKEDIRRNRRNIAEKLGFLGRVIHGSNPRLWLKNLKSCRGSACRRPRRLAQPAKGTVEVVTLVMRRQPTPH
jgi:hypothetical protein